MGGKDFFLTGVWGGGNDFFSLKIWGARTFFKLKIGGGGRHFFFKINFWGQRLFFPIKMGGKDFFAIYFPWIPFSRFPEFDDVIAISRLCNQIRFSPISRI
jgi:hypothetical protein